MKKRFWLALVPGLFSALAASAHEVWIEPTQWDVAPATSVEANIRNGQYFEGFDLTWNDKTTIRAEAWDQQGDSKIEGRLGDRPALQIEDPNEGLLVLLHQSDYRTLVYDSFEKFTSFVTEKGYEDVLAQHAERRLPETQVKEAYARFSKSLVSVGDGEGSDAFREMELELVALTNPYSSAGEPMEVQLFYQGAPLPDNRVTVFQRAPDMTVTEVILQTDADGKARFPTEGGTTYLVDSVVLREPSRDLVVATRGAVWESLWASLTFHAPEDQ